MFFHLRVCVPVHIESWIYMPLSYVRAASVRMLVRKPPGARVYG